MTPMMPLYEVCCHKKFQINKEMTLCKIWRHGMSRKRELLNWNTFLSIKLVVEYVSSTLYDTGVQNNDVASSSLDSEM